MIALLSPLFIKGALLTGVAFNFVHSCFSKTFEKNSINLGYEL